MNEPTKISLPFTCLSYSLFLALLKLSDWKMISLKSTKAITFFFFLFCHLPSFRTHKSAFLSSLASELKWKRSRRWQREKNKEKVFCFIFSKVIDLPRHTSIWVQNKSPLCCCFGHDSCIRQIFDDFQPPNWLTLCNILCKKKSKNKGIFWALIHL